MKSNEAKKKKKGGSLGLGLWMMLASLFEPRKTASTELIDTQRRIGSDAERTARAAAGKPADDR